MSAQVARWDAYRSQAFGSITASYVQVGTAFSHLIRVLKFVNTTNASISVSFDGTTDNDIVPANSFCLYDLQTNCQANYKFTLSNGTPVLIKYTSGAPTSGTFYVVGIYGKDE